MVAATLEHSVASRQHDQFGHYGTWSGYDPRSAAKQEADRVEAVRANNRLSEVQHAYKAWLQDPANRNHPYCLALARESRAMRAEGHVW